MLIRDKDVSLGCNIQLRKWFFTIFNLENDLSPVQFVVIMVKYILNAISMYVWKRVFKTVYLNKAVQFRYCWMRNFVLTPTVDVMLEMYAFRNQILFIHVSVIKGSQFSAKVFNCLDVYFSKFSKETEQAVYFFISCQSV